MAQELKGKVAVVTGGGGDIGKGIALALAAEGAKVVVNDVSRDPDGNSAADKAVEEIKKAGGTAAANYDSVATMQGGENIVKTATSNFGRIDILVNCAGNFKVVKSVEMTEEDWDSIIDVHLKGHFSCTKAAALEMMKQKSGRIINISSRGAPFGRVPGNRIFVELDVDDPRRRIGWFVVLHAVHDASMRRAFRRAGRMAPRAPPL